jgi:hypothetical protein
VLSFIQRNRLARRVRLTCWPSWNSLISLLNTISCFRNRSAWTLSFTDATCVHNFLYHFLIEFAFGGSFSKFYLNSRWTLSHFWLSCHFKSVLYYSGKSWNYFLCVHAEKTFWFALYNGVSLSFVWLLFSYKYIYIIAHIICNHPFRLPGKKRTATLTSLSFASLPQCNAFLTGPKIW